MTIAARLTLKLTLVALAALIGCSEDKKDVAIQDDDHVAYDDNDVYVGGDDDGYIHIRAPHTWIDIKIPKNKREQVGVNVDVDD